MSDFFRKHGLILSEVFWYMEWKKNLEKKYFLTVQKKLFFWEGLTVETRFLDIEKSNSKTLLSNDSKYKTNTRGYKR